MKGQEVRDEKERVGLLQINDVAIMAGHLRALEGGRRCQNYSIWSYDENYAYITYLSNFKWAFVDQFSRKKYQVYMHMSRFLKTRNHNQIKSHHQKMIMKYGDIDKAIKGIVDHTMDLIAKIPELMEIISEINAKFEAFYEAQGNLREKASITRSKPRIQKNKRKIKQASQEPILQELPLKKEGFEVPYIFYPQNIAFHNPLLKLQDDQNTIKMEE